MSSPMSRKKFVLAASSLGSVIMADLVYTVHLMTQRKLT
jgi:hypothetical protein